jgi:twitching motility protein PilI
MQPAVPEPLLAPTAALLRNFEFDAPAPAPRAGAPAPGGDVLLREGFRVGPLHLAIRYEDGSELTDLPAVHALPRAPAWFRGMANLHGSLVPVFDPATLFGVAAEAGAKRMLLVVGHDEGKAGLVIDGLPVRLKLSACDRLQDAAVPAPLAGCVNAAYWSGDDEWMDLDTAGLLDRLEQQLTGT